MVDQIPCPNCGTTFAVAGYLAGFTGRQKSGLAPTKIIRVSTGPAGMAGVLNKPGAEPTPAMRRHPNLGNVKSLSPRSRA
jgi:hypothetical protein